MKKWIVIGTFCVLMTVSLIGYAGEGEKQPVVPAEKAEMIETLKRDLEVAHKEIEVQRKDLASFNKEIEIFKKDLAASKQEIETLKKKVAEMGREKALIEATLHSWKDVANSLQVRVYEYERQRANVMVEEAKKTYGDPESFKKPETEKGKK